MIGYYEVKTEIGQSHKLKEEFDTFEDALICFLITQDAISTYHSRKDKTISIAFKIIEDEE